MALDTFKPYLFVSAGEQSNKFLTPTYADGIAQFQAQRAQELTGLTVRIDPIQEGTGDPSPTNIRPISGRTGMTVTRAGANLLPMPITSGSYPNNVTITVNDDKSFYFSKPSGTNWTTFNLGIFSLPAGTYTLIEDASDASQGASLSLRIAGTDTIIVQSRYTKRQSFTLTETTFIDARYARSTTGDNILTKLMLFVGSTATAADYEPYNGQTYPVTWETQAGTVYGGTLDVVSGVLTVDKGYYTITDADSPVLFQTGANANRVGVVVNGSAPSPTVADRLNIMSNIAKADASILTQSQQAVGTCCLYSAGADTASKVLFGVPTTEDTAAKAKAWLIAQGCAFVYPLATPQTYQLTGAEVRTIAGFNQIYSDAGPVIDIKF